MSTLNNTAEITRTSAILVSLNISAWTARAYDREASEELNNMRNAKKGSGRVNKMLLPSGAESFHALMSHQGALRDKHYKLSLIWSDNGTRLLPFAHRDAYQEMIREGRQESERLLEVFLENYPEMKRLAKLPKPIGLGDLYEENDYLSAADIRKRFTIAVSYDPVPVADFSRLPLSDGERREMEERAERRIRERINQSMGDVWNRLHTVVKRMHDTLSDPDAKIYETMYNDVYDMVELLGPLNITGDPEMARLKDEADRALFNYSTDTMRASRRARSNVAAAAGQILQAIERKRIIRPQSEAA